MFLFSPLNFGWNYSNQLTSSYILAILNGFPGPPKAFRANGSSFPADFQVATGCRSDSWTLDWNRGFHRHNHRNDDGISFVSSVLVAVLFGQNGCGYGYGYGLLAKSKHRYLHSGTQAPKFGPRLFLLSSEMLKASLILFSVSLDSGFMPLALALAGT